MEKNQPPQKKRDAYFEDYIYEKVPRKNGRGSKTQRVYAGDYHQQSLLPSQRHWLRVLYVGLFFLSLGFTMAAAGRYIHANTSWFVGVAQAAIFGCYAWMLLAFVIYIPTGHNFTKGEWRGGALALRYSSLGVTIAVGVAALFTLIHYIFNAKYGYSAGTGWSLLCYLPAGGAALAINRIESRVPYAIVPSERKQALAAAPPPEEDAADRA